MKRFALRSIILALVPALLLPFSAFAQGPQEGAQGEGGAPRGGGGGPGEREKQSPVQKEMEIINRDARKLNRQYSDPAQKASSLQIVSEMQKSAEKAKDLTPSLAEKKSEAEKSKFMAAYKKNMDALIKELAALKDAVDAGDNDKTKAELDKINQLKGSSHKELGVKMGGPGGGRGPGGPGGPGGGPGGERRTGPPPGGAAQSSPATSQASPTAPR